MKTKAIRVKRSVRLGYKTNCPINSWLLSLSSPYRYKAALTDQWLTFMPYPVINAKKHLRAKITLLVDSPPADESAGYIIAPLKRGFLPLEEYPAGKKYV